MQTSLRVLRFALPARDLPVPTLVAALVLSLALAATPAQAQPSFSKVFTPDTLASGSVSTLIFTITNGSGVPVTNLAFTDNLPAAVSVATPAAVTSTCPDAVVTAGGGSIMMTDGEVAAFASCTVSVDVTSSTVGTHTNTSGDLTSSAGNSGTSTDDLTVVTNRPAFSKAFAPSTIDFGERTTLTLTIDNSVNPGFATALSFTDALPSGLVIADPANASADCPGAFLTAMAGGGTISISSGLLLPGQTCTVTVDVAGSAIGSFINRTELSSTPGGPSVSSGFATAQLDVTLDPDLHITKGFVGNPVAPGNTVVMDFTIRNQSPSDSATGVTFTDDLSATLAGLVAVGLPANDVCGAGSQLTGTGLLTLTGGNIPARDVCTFSVTLQVPAGAAVGNYPNTTSAVSATVGGSSVTGNQATEILYVSPVPVLTKTFLTDPVGAGGTTTIEFTITNSSPTAAATDLGFADNLSAFLSGSVYTSGIQNNICGAGSVLTTTLNNGQTFLTLFSGSLAAGASCTFTADVQIPAGGAPGTYVNTTSDVTGTIGGLPVFGPPASDTLDVVVGPLLTKEFTDDPVDPGDMVTLEFTLTHDAAEPADATNIAFTDDLNAALVGLSAIGLPLNDVCGTGSQISGTTNLSFTGGTLAPGASCTFSVTLQVPVAALPGTYTNLTSNVSSTVGGVAASRAGAQDNLLVGGLSFTKEFIDDPLLPGGTGTLRFTIDNQSTVDATGMFFTDNLPSALTGLTTTGALPANPCGAGSVLSGPSFLILVGGNLTAGTSCTFDVTVDVPGGAADGGYLNTTSNLTATLGGSGVTVQPAADQLTIDSTRLALTKTFTNDPVQPGGSLILEFTITNDDMANAASGVSFTDDLDAALSGLVAVGLPQNDVCGAGSLLSGAGLLTLTGGSLAADGSCTFSVGLQVPGGAGSGVYTNTTSGLTGMITGLSVTGPAASDDFVVSVINFDKAFDGPTVATGTAVLTFLIENLNATDASGLEFTDDLDAMIPGLVAVGLPLNDVCGTGSQLTGTSVISLTDGTVPGSGTCMFDVTVQVPAGVMPGAYLNTSDPLFQNGLQAAEPTTASLTIDAPPSFSKAFDGPTVATGTAVLTFTIQNNSARAIDNLSFTDDLAAAIPGMVGTGLPLNDVCGTGSQISGTSALSFTGGSLAGNASCMIAVTVQVPAGVTPSSYLNTTSDLLRNGLALSPPASANLTIDAPPTFSKAFDGPTTATGTAVLTFTIQNNSTRTLSGLSFTDDLDTAIPGMVGTGLPVNDVCGTGSQISGTSLLSLTGGNLAGNATCMVPVTVQVPAGVTPSSYLNTTSDLLQNGLVLSPPASANLVIEPPPTFSKIFVPDVIVTDTVSTLTFTIDNSASTLAANNLAFVDNLPTNVVVATPANSMTTCGGTVTAVDGTASISFTGGTVGAGATCTVSVDVTSSTVGSYTNLTLDLTSTSGNSGTATAMLEVVPPLMISKRFVPASVLPGQVAQLEYTLDNPSTLDLTNIAFTDDLGTVLPGLAANALSLPADVPAGPLDMVMLTDICGLGSQINGTNLLTFTGGNLLAGTSCTFSVDVTIPANAAVGTYPSTTSDPTGDAGGVPVVGAAGAASLIVRADVLEIPTLDEWALLLLIGLLGAVAVARMRF